MRPGGGPKAIRNFGGSVAARAPASRLQRCESRGHWRGAFNRAPNCVVVAELLGELGKISDLMFSAESENGHAMLTSRSAQRRFSDRPGNVYLANPNEGDKCPVTRLKLDLLTIVESCQPKWGGQYGPTLQKLTQTDKMSKDDAEASEELKILRREFASKCELIALEVSPVCDFSQAKRPVSRLVAGVLVSDDVFKSFTSLPPFLKAIKGIQIPLRDGVHHLVLNARFAFGIENPDTCIETKALFRLRSPLVVDIQSWIASHLARPGYLSV